MPGKPFDFAERDYNISPSYEFRIDRSVYNEFQFAKKFRKSEQEDNIKAKISASLSGRKCSRGTLLGFILSLIPVLKWLPNYNLKKDLVRDIAGGLTVGIMQIPQGMAYAMLTTLPPIYGLYVSFVPVLVYCIFGTSRHISLGTFAIVCLMNGDVIGKFVSNYSPDEPNSSNMNFTMNTTMFDVNQVNLAEYKTRVAVTLSFVAGIIQIGLGIVRLGFLTKYLSDPLISGFTTGAAFHILSSQFRHFLGMEVPSGTNSGYFSLFKLYTYFFTHLKEVNVSALLTGIICSMLLFLLKYANQKYKFKFPIPAELIVVALGCTVSYTIDFNKKFNTPILKMVPTGMPALTMPQFSLIKDLIPQGVVIAMVAFAVNVSLAKSFARKNDYGVDSNQELIAYGLANTVSSFFSCFPSAASLSRSVIQEALGSTQVCGFISVALVLLVLLSIAPLFQPLPNAVLAAIVLVALKGLFKQFIVLKYLWKISKIDAFIWFASFLAVFCLGVDTGLAVGFIVNMLTVFARTSKPSMNVLGSASGTGIYKRIDKYQVKETPGLKILQFNAPLYYANVEHFMNMFLEHAKVNDSTTGGASIIQNFSVNGVENYAVLSDSFGQYDEAYKEEDCLISSLSSAIVHGSNRLQTQLSAFSISDNIDLISCLNEEPLHSVILDCSLISFIDSMGVSTLGSIVDEYKKDEVEVYLACCSENVISMLASGGFFAIHGKERLFVTVHDALLHCISSKTLRDQLYKGNAQGTEDEKLQNDSCEITVSNDSAVSEDLGVSDGSTASIG